MSMTPARAAVIVAGGGLLAAWLAAAAARLPVVAQDPVATPAGASAPVDPALTDLQAQAARLRERLGSGPPLRHRRDPFTFAPVVRKAPRVTPVAAAFAPVALPEPPRPAVTLVGIAEETPDLSHAESKRRTAVISAFDQLFMVKEGELVTPRFRVAAIGTDVVELVDLTDHTAFRIALK
ncbi:MAG: hypothetical protein HYX76_00700 [Acidobacteria bacterium]|nr:hypothetical protein [Acidobacteriota bacterium]